MIRVLLVDDHPALRAGLLAVLRAEPGFVPVGAAAEETDLWPLLNRTRPDAILLDYHLPGRDGLVLCRKIKNAVPAPKVLLYSAYADASLTIPAILAGADGIVNKATPANELFDALRTVVGGGEVLPQISRELLDAASAKVAAEDLPILGMLLDHTPHPEVAKTVGVEPEELSRRVDRMIELLRVEVPSSYA